MRKRAIGGWFLSVRRKGQGGGACRRLGRPPCLFPVRQDDWSGLTSCCWPEPAAEAARLIRVTGKEHESATERRFQVRSPCPLVPPSQRRFYDSELCAASNPPWFRPDGRRHRWRPVSVSSPFLLCSLFCVGNSPSAAILKQYPLVPQRTWSGIINWIFDRFDRYRQLKTDHDQWDTAGRTVWSDFERSRGSGSTFEETLRDRFMLPRSAV